jgi:hypothetical protein
LIAFLPPKGSHGAMNAALTADEIALNASRTGPTEFRPK